MKNNEYLKREDAFHNIGGYLAKEKDNDCVEILTDALAHGDYSAANDIGSYYYHLDNFELAKYWYKLAADKGVEIAIYNMMKIYKNTEPNKDLMLKWANKGIELRFSRLYFELGIAYENGELVEQNYEKAFEYYKKGIDPEYVDEVYYKNYANLAYLYAEGLGTKKNLKKSAELYRIAAEKGNEIAKYFYGKVLYYGEGTEVDKDLAFKYFFEASKKGNDDANPYLADICVDKMSRYHSYTMARFFLGIGYEHNHKDSIIELFNFCCNKEWNNYDLNVAYKVCRTLCAKHDLTDEDVERIYKAKQYVDNKEFWDDIKSLIDKNLHKNSNLQALEEALEKELKKEKEEKEKTNDK